jgi:predicted aspartyl protease
MKRTRRIAAFVLLLGSWAAAQTASPTPVWVSELGYKPEELFPITINRYGFPMVTVEIDGTPLALVFDTGNTTGLSLSTENAEKLRLQTTGAATSYDTNNTALSQDRVFRAGQVTSLGRKWKDVPVHELRGTALPGLIGPVFLRGRRFTIDYKNKILAVSSSDLPKNAAGDRLPLLPTYYRGMIVVRGLVNGREVLIQIDTGKSRTCVDPVLIRELKLPKVGNGYRIEQIRLGTVDFSTSPAKDVDFSGIGEGLPGPILLGIGSDVLANVVFTVDYRSGVAMLWWPKK